MKIIKEKLIVVYCTAQKKNNHLNTNLRMGNEILVNLEGERTMKKVENHCAKKQNLT